MFNKRLLIIILLIASVGYIGYLIVNNFNDISLSINKVQWWGVVGAIVIALPMYYLKALYHYYTLKRVSGMKIVPENAIQIYLQSQIIRYLPGKVWGVIYQSQRMSNSLPTTVIVLANLIQMITTNILAVGVVISLMAVIFFDSLLFLFLIPLFFLLLEIEHRLGFFQNVFLWLSVKLRLQLPLIKSSVNPADRWKLSFFLLSEWFFFFAVFFMLWGHDYRLSDIFSLGAWYSLATLVSMVFIFMPGGIAIREALFVSSANIYFSNQADLLVMSTLLRLVWISSEIFIAFGLTAYYKWLKNG